MIIQLPKYSSKSRPMTTILPRNNPKLPLFRIIDREISFHKKFSSFKTVNTSTFSKRRIDKDSIRKQDTIQTYYYRSPIVPGVERKERNLFVDLHHLYGFKTQTSVLPNELDIRQNNMHFESVADIKTFLSNPAWHV